MMETLRYIGLSLALGGLTVWASENLFWMMPPADLTLLGLGMTVVAYAIAASAALSVVIWAGLGGLPAAFLGGAALTASALVLHQARVTGSAHPA